MSGQVRQAKFQVGFRGVFFDYFLDKQKVMKLSADNANKSEAKNPSP
jgi:hypothetical protein